MDVPRRNRVTPSDAFLTARRQACLAGSAGAIVALALLLAAEPVRSADLKEAVELYRTGKYAECANYTAKAIAEEAFSENYRLLKIRAELELGRYPDALKSWEDAVQRFPYSLQLRWLGRTVVRLKGQDHRVAEIDGEISKLVGQSTLRYRDAVNHVVVGRFLLSQGADPKRVLTDHFNEVKRRQPGYVEAHLACGELALAKHDYALAAEAYQQAVKIDGTDPDAHLGLAKAFAPSDSEKAEAALSAALGLNPQHVESLLMAIDEHIDAERYDDAQAVLDKVKAVNPHEPRALAYRAVLAHLTNQPQSEALHRKAALAWWKTNPEVDHLIGKKLSQKYRFAEGAARQREALQLDPEYLPAKMQLASDLLRLGEVQEGWKLAQEVYDEDGYNVVAHNLVTLQDSLSKFRTLEADGILLRMDAREAEIYGQHVLDLLRRAKRTLCAKYDVQLERPIMVEMFPRQEDFAIRTFGLPGGAGFLGVCFGTVITANSPASQGESPSNWEATLWHEFCHVVTLNKTNNKMPRWLSEGISVYEERQADPTWGQSINPRYREMLLSPELTPVSELSGAFLSPKSPLHLQFAYYESSLVVEFLVEKYGLDTLKRVLVDLGVGMPINESLARYTGSLEALNAQFTEFARKRAAAMAPEADWSEPELPRRVRSEVLAAWVKDNPSNYAGLRRWARQLMAEGKWEEAKQPLARMRQLYPEDASADGPYSLLARVHRELGETDSERTALEKLAALSADDVQALLRLTELTAAAEDWEASAKYARRLLAVAPLRPDVQRAAARAAEETADHALAHDSVRALLLLDPIDPAELHLRLATLLQNKGDLVRAKRQALLALERTPRYRAAHQRLLDIVTEMKEQAGARTNDERSGTND